ncbi:MAG: nicotinamidase-related amidase [Arenicella sp.]|jgi:nicotinamidase-related amidase|tara:strand:+ start:13 stop:681 length:669 start_codon:yes stop_codon:yes gene_type:complete
MTQPNFIDSFSQQVSIDPTDTVLLVIDMQNATGNRHMGLGKLLSDAGKASDASFRFDRIDNLLVPKISALLDSFRANNANIIYITYGAEIIDARDVPAHMKPIVVATNNIIGREEHKIVEALTPREGELVLNKTTQGAFKSTKIDTVLRALKAKTVVCVGVSTNNCVAMTAMEACDSQYKVVVVSDATGTDSDEMQESTLKMLGRLWARVMTTNEVIESLSK